LKEDTLEWQDTITVDFKEIRRDWANWIRVSRDRIEWKDFIQMGTVCIELDVCWTAARQLDSLDGISISFLGGNWSKVHTI